MSRRDGTPDRRKGRVSTNPDRRAAGPGPDEGREPDAPATRAGGRTGIDASRLAPSAAPDAGTGCDHLVQFYERDAFLVETACRFVAEGAGGRVVIASGPHLDGIDARLRAAGLDPEADRMHGRYVTLDAAETPSRVVDRGRLDERRLLERLEGVIATASRGGREPVRVFGEMVALLWTQGHREAALRLEALWNGLARRDAVEILCAYPMQSFTSAADAAPFGEICEKHSRVLPADGYAELTAGEDRRRTIARLQQRASALEAEVAARAALEARLRRREAELSDFLDNTVEGLHRVDPDGTILWANRAELAMLGYAPDEYVGRHVADFHVDRDVADDILARLLRGESLRDQPARLRCKDGSIREVLIASSSLHEDGRLLYTRCFTRDVTERLAWEREMATLLAREQAARAEAESAVLAREVFLARASHELRTPLTSALGTIHLLERAIDGRLKERPEGLVAIARRNLSTILTLVTDLLDASKLALGNEPIALEPVELSVAVAAAFELVGAPAREKGVALREAVPPGLTVAAEPARLEQLLVNLLTNAVTFTPPGGEVVVEAEPTGAAGVAIRVHDTGIGIAPEAIEKVFEPFFRVERGPAGGAPRGAAPRGSGLGLAICRRIVARHGGRIWAESGGAGRGSTFVVHLPRDADQKT
ncbi:MAG TPA: ATP-binding protein [Thermodesulfobacteriota bacterium]